MVESRGFDRLSYCGNKEAKSFAAEEAVGGGARLDEVSIKSFSSFFTGDYDISSFYWRDEGLIGVGAIITEGWEEATEPVGLWPEDSLALKKLSKVGGFSPGTLMWYLVFASYVA